MANILWNCTGIIGGASGNLDDLSGDSLTDGDRALVNESGVLYVYEYDSSATGITYYPSVIRPVDYATYGGNWLNLNVSTAILQEKSKASSFTAEPNQYYYTINFTEIGTITLPSTGLNSGDSIYFMQPGIHNLTFTCDSVDINASSSDLSVDTNGPITIIARYFATYGWAVTMQATAV